MLPYKIYFLSYSKKRYGPHQKRLILIKEGLELLNINVSLDFLCLDDYKNVNVKKKFFKLNFYYIKYLYDFFSYIRSVSKSKKYFQPIIYIKVTNSIIFCLLVLTFRILKIKICVEKTETFKIPPFINRLQKFRANLSFRLIKMGLYFCNIVLVNSIALKEDMNTLNQNVKQLPGAIVDYDYFSKCEKSNFLNKLKCRYICYAGNLVEEQNGSFTLLEAFSDLCKTEKNIFLVFVGAKNHPEYKILLDKCKELNLERNVVFTSFLREDNLRKILHYASVLAILKPYNYRNLRNFPGKISEYLSTGNPVISTSLETIAKILKNEISSFLVKEFSVKNITDKLKFILNNESFAKKVGKEGQLIAKQEFDKKENAKKLIAFLNIK